MSQINAAAEAIRALTDRRVMSKEQFLQLPDEARLRAFTIARQTEAAVLQKTLDAVRTHLQEGGTMWTFREKFPEIVKPYTEAGREWHLRLVVRQNVRQAQAVGAHAQRQRVKAAFPYVEYRTGPNARPNHAALDGKIFAVDDPFLKTHTPPWEHGCNCDLVPRTAAQVGRVQNEESGKPLDERRVVAGNPQLENLARQNKMPDPQAGGMRPVDLRPANQKPDGDDYSFRPDALNQPIDLSGYGEDIRTRLGTQLRDLGYEISPDGLKATPVAKPTPTLPPTPFKTSRVGPPLHPKTTFSAFKAPGSPTLAAQRGNDRVGRPMGRLGVSAPQIAGGGRVGPVKNRRVA